MYDAMTSPAAPLQTAESEKSVPHTAPPSGDFQHLVRHCVRFKGAQTKRAVFQLALTFALFCLSTAAMLWLLERDFHLPALLLALPTGGFLVRLFIIQHDCGHLSFFKSRKANTVIGSLLSVLTFTPYGYWRDAHNIHHAGSGDLARRGIGSIDMLTVAEYNALPARQRFFYRLYRHPAVVLLLGPPLHIIGLQRLPFANTLLFIEEFRCLPTKKIWRSITILDIALALFYGGAVALFGVKAALLALLPPVFVAAWAGGWLFFVQHQFENAYWKRAPEWSFQEAAVRGSSYYVLPRVLQWFTGNIGLHHIHHLCSLIPNYRLQACLDASPELQAMNRLTFRESLKCATLALWDEAQQKMIRFRDLKPA